MALTILDCCQHARKFLKANDDYASSEEINFANTLNSIISRHYRWHWNTQAGGNITIGTPVQDYSLAVADQNNVMYIQAQSCYLTDATSTYPAMMTDGNYALPVTSVLARPVACGLISPALMRFYNAPNATYTFHWRYHARPTVLTSNGQSLDCPTAFGDVVKAGFIWQFMSYADDTREDAWQKTFVGLLDAQKQSERVTSGRTR